MDLRTAVETARERRPLGDHNGKSGATLERVLLADGRGVVVKRFAPDEDLVMRLTRDTRGREVEMCEAGLFDRLPAEVGHAALGGWFADGVGVLIMRDLGSTTLGWDDRLDPERCQVMLHGILALHRRFQGRPPDGLASLADATAIFQPDRIRPFAGDPLIDAALRGWEYWSEVAPGEVGALVLDLALDPTPLVKATADVEPTMLHGDLATVNMAFETPDRLTLIDWGLAFPGPGGLDVGRFLAGCGHVLDLDLDGFLAMYREEAGGQLDVRGTELGLLNGLVWLGWNKALDIVEHPRPEVRDRERSALEWWLTRAAEVFESGL